MRSIIPAFLLFVLCLTGCAASRYALGNAEFVLHSGSSFTNAANKVETWGIWMSDGSSVLFRQLDRITTRSSRLADAIAEAVPSVAIDSTSEGYLLRFADMEFPARPPASPRVGLLADKRMHVGGHLGPFAGVETHMGIVPSRANNLQVTLGTSIGWNVFHLGDSPGTAGFFGGFAAGIEYTRPAGPADVGFAARVWKRYARHPDLRSSGPEHTAGPDALSIGIMSTHALSQHLAFSFELRAYLWDETYDGYKSRATLIVLLRRSFGKAYNR